MFRRIFSEYRLGEYRSARRLTAGKVEENWLVRTATDRYVLRRYRCRRRESVLFEIEVLKYLRARKYPCPAPIPDRHGGYVGMHQGLPFAVFSFCEGRHIQRPTPGQKRQLTVWVARLQKLTRNYRPRSTRARLNYNIAMCRKLAWRIARGIGTANARAKLKWFEKALRAIRLPRSLPKGICHCDFHFSNVLFRNCRFSALLDFDDANYTYLAYDLMCLADPFRKSFNWKTWSRFARDADVFDFREPRRTVVEYLRHRALDRAEKDHLFDIFKLTVMIDCLWYFRRGRAAAFHEKRKIEYLDRLGRADFNSLMLGKQA